MEERSRVCHFAEGNNMHVSAMKCSSGMLIIGTLGKEGGAIFVSPRGKLVVAI